MEKINDSLVQLFATLLDVRGFCTGQSNQHLRFFLVSVTYPVLGIEGKVDVQATPKSVNYEIEGAYENQKVSSKLNSKVNTKEPGDFTIYFDVGI